MAVEELITRTGAGQISRFSVVCKRKRLMGLEAVIREVVGFSIDGHDANRLLVTSGHEWLV